MKSIPAHVTLAAARTLASDLLQACGTNKAAAASVAHALVAAEADGLVGHGLSRLPAYMAQVRAGKIDGAAVPSVASARPTLFRVDACQGFAYPAIDLAIAELIDAARAEGLAAATIFRSHHCGAMGLHVERLAREGFCALMFANTPPAIAPAGGRTALFGTNPIAFAAPVHGAEPIVIDLSISKVARGRIMAAKQKGQSIPEGWALDVDGRPTTDPAAALAGTMLPMGDDKGAALALMIEILAACLTGAVLSKDATSFLDDKGGPPGAGQIIIALDVDPASGGAYFDRMAALVAAIGAETGARLPGARRFRARAQALAEGLTLNDGLRGELSALSA